MPPCLTLSIIRYGSRVKWSNPGKGVVPFPTPWCSSYQKGSLRVTLDYGHQLYLNKIFMSLDSQCNIKASQKFWNICIYASLQNKLQELEEIELLPHPAHSLDLDPLDYYLF